MSLNVECFRFKFGERQTLLQISNCCVGNAGAKLYYRSDVCVEQCTFLLDHDVARTGLNAINFLKITLLSIVIKNKSNAGRKHMLK